MGGADGLLALAGQGLDDREQVGIGHAVND
jgi:hypothetical protein